MSTICAVKKNGRICLAADTATSFGDLVVGSELVASSGKLLRFEDTWFGVTGSVAHGFALGEALLGMDGTDFSGPEAIYRTFLGLHAILKEDIYLKTDEDDDDPYESSQMNLLVVNRSGLYSVHSYRDVLSYNHYWAIGSGADYALGAMRALYEDGVCEDVARAGVEAGCAFDSGSRLPCELQSIETD
jgi:ATP-dependent protease HslVU (ClpYQ) peptidase subunit